MTVRVRLLGRPRIGDGGQSFAQPRAQKSWAVLGRIALAERPVSRRDLAAELFGDADDPLGALRWALADLRRSLRLPQALRSDPLHIPATTLWLDVRALAAGELPWAEVGGALLDGIEVRGCPGFESWLLLARSRVAARCREELRRAALDLLSSGDTEPAVEAAHRAALLDPLDEGAQELFLRTLVAAGHEAQACVHLEMCTAAFVREGISPTPALREAARARERRPRSGVRAAVVARSLLQAGSAALSAGAADAGVETLRRAAEDGERAGDAALQAEVLHALGGALVHAVRGFDGEGAIVLHRALAAARTARRPELAADILRELAFVDLQAGRHASADRALREAAQQATMVGNDALTARLLAVQGMNAADRGRHGRAAALLTESAGIADRTGSLRQQAWSLGVLARSLLLSGHVGQAGAAAERSIDLARQERWHAFLPFPQVMRAQVGAQSGDWEGSQEDAETAFALACELRDPCWEGLAGRALALVAAHFGDLGSAHRWTADARQRCDRVSDRYVWVSAYIGLAELELAATELEPAARNGGDGRGAGAQRSAAVAAAGRLHHDAVRADLPEFLAWALIHQAELGDRASVPHARAAAQEVDNPVLQSRVQALDAG